MVIKRLPDGTEVVEGSPEELAEYHNKRENSDAEKKRERRDRGRNKKLLNEIKAMRARIEELEKTLASAWLITPTAIQPYPQPFAPTIFPPDQQPWQTEIYCGGSSGYKIQSGDTLTLCDKPSQAS